MRFDHWERRLAACLDKHKRIPHQWGKHDCAIGFVADCVWAITQKDPAAPWRRTYATETGALRLVAEHPGGLAGLVEAGLASIGVPVERIPPSMAQRGDICMVAGEGAAGALGICFGAEIVGKGLEGLERRPLSSATIVWALR